MTHYTNSMREITVMCGALDWMSITNVKEAVTCPVCLKLIADSEPAHGGEEVG